MTLRIGTPRWLLATSMAVLLVAAPATGCRTAPALQVSPTDSVVPPAAARTTAARLLKLTPADSGAGDQFGPAVAISGDTAVVGAPFKNSYAGAVYVFVHSGPAWVQQAVLTAGDAAKDDLFGWSVAIDGDTAAIGAYGRNYHHGAVYIFTRDGSSWSQQAEFTVSGSSKGGEPGAPETPGFGCSVSVSGNTVVAGANNSYNATGAAFVYTRTGNVWRLEAELSGNDTKPYDEFGAAVAVSGDTAVIVDFGRSQQGAAYVFVRSGGAWEQQAYLTAMDNPTGDGFRSVAVSGDTVILGAPGVSGQTRGTAFVFVRHGSAWEEQSRLDASDASNEDLFGISVSIDKDGVAVGAFGRNDGAGAAYTFQRHGSAWNQQAILTAGDAETNAEFGYAVSISGQTVIAGSPLINGHAGAAYVY